MLTAGAAALEPGLAPSTPRYLSPVAARNGTNLPALPRTPLAQPEAGSLRQPVACPHASRHVVPAAGVSADRAAFAGGRVRAVREAVNAASCDRPGGVELVAGIRAGREAQGFRRTVGFAPGGGEGPARPGQRIPVRILDAARERHPLDRRPSERRSR